MDISPKADELARHLISQVRRQYTSDDTVSSILFRIDDDQAEGVIRSLAKNHAKDLRDVAIADVHRMSLWDGMAALGRPELVHPLLDAMILGEEHACYIIVHNTLVDPGLRREVIAYAVDNDWHSKFLMVSTAFSARNVMEANGDKWVPVLADFIGAYKWGKGTLTAKAALDEYAKKRAKITDFEERQALDKRLVVVLETCRKCGVDFERLERSACAIQKNGASERVTKDMHGVLHWTIDKVLRHKNHEHYLAGLHVLVDQGLDWRKLENSGVLEPDELALLRQVPAVRRELLAAVAPEAGRATPRGPGRM